ncbi:MAG: efflux RND transporter periplasmic adaptor subunit [Vampirovibrionales bacterium]|nr:efflux RND transporter periplasmic adaptor subunit [Vampirovibrionales bacterium]
MKILPTVFRAMARHWRFVLLTLLALAILTVSLMNFYRSEPVLAVQAQRRDALITLTVTGAIAADNTVSVTAPFQARITAIHTRQGNAISAGQPLVTLEADDSAAALAQAQAQMREARAALAFVSQGTRPEDLSRLKSRIQEADWQRTQAQAALKSAQADADQARRYVERMTPLAKDGAISANEYDALSARAQAAAQTVSSLQSAMAASAARAQQARDDYEKGRVGPTGPERQQASAAYEAARQRARMLAAQLGQRVIRSPLSGITLARLQEPGDIAMPGQPILRIADRGTLEVEAYVEESELSRIATGQHCEVVLDASPETPLACVVREIGDEVNPDNGTVIVKANIVSQRPEASPSRLLSGMQADITFMTGSLRQAITLPATAVEKAGAGWRTYVISQGKAHARAVTARRISLETVEIQSGLQPGEWVARAASSDLLAKRRVVAQPAPSPDDKSRAASKPPSR